MKNILKDVGSVNPRQIVSAVSEILHELKFTSYPTVNNHWAYFSSIKLWKIGKKEFTKKQKFLKKNFSENFYWINIQKWRNILVFKIDFCKFFHNKQKSQKSIFLIKIFPWRKRIYGPFLWIGFSCVKTAEPLQGDSLLFTTQSWRVLGTHLIDVRRRQLLVEYWSRRFILLPIIFTFLFEVFI